MGVSQRQYAKHRQVALSAVQKALRTGRITVGADGLIDPAVADRDWAARTAPRMNGQNGHPAPKAPASSNSATVAEFRAPEIDSGAFQRARTRKMRTDAKRAALELRVRQGQLVARATVERHLFAFGRQLREHWRTWPARIGPELAATLEVDPFVLITHLEEAVRVELVAIADERCTF